MTRALSILAVTVVVVTAWPTEVAAQHVMPRSGASSGRLFQPTSQSSFYIGIPLVQDVDREVVRTGASIEGRAGVDMGFVVPEVELGFTWIPVDLDKVAPGLGRDSLNQIYVGVGVRLQARNDSLLTPYLSGALDFNWWHFRETDIICDLWYCQSVRRYRFTPGISGRLGLEIEITPYAAIDFGCRLFLSFAGDFFTRNEWWVEPYVGFTLHF